MTTIKYTCVLCQKKYKILKYFENHKIYCNIKNKAKDEIKDNLNNENNHLSIKDLNIVIKGLVSKMDKMQTEMNRLTNIVDKTVKCIDILDWLNDENNKADVDDYEYESFINNFEVTSTDLDNLFEHNYIQELSNIIIRNIEKYNSIKAFTEKKNKFYIYSDKNTNIQKRWREMTKIEFNNFINKVKSKILKKFAEWQKEHEKEIIGNPENSNYNEKVIKILGNNMTIQHISSKVKYIIFNHIKFDIKSISKISL